MSTSGSTPDGSDPPALREQIADNQRTIDRLNRDLAKRSDEVRIIQQISSEITSSMILLKDLAAEKLRLFASRGYEPSGVGAEVAFGHGIVGVVAERKKMMRIGNIGTTIAYLTNIRTRMEAAGEMAPGAAAAVIPGLPKAQSQLALPLLVKDRLVGVLAVESPKLNAFDELDEMLLRIVANQAPTTPSRRTAETSPSSSSTFAGSLLSRRPPSRKRS